MVEGRTVEQNLESDEVAGLVICSPWYTDDVAPLVRWSTSPPKGVSSLGESKPGSMPHKHKHTGMLNQTGEVPD